MLRRNAFSGEFTSLTAIEGSLRTLSCKVSDILPDFNRVGGPMQAFIKVPISDLTEIRPVGAILLHLDRCLDGRTH